MIREDQLISIGHLYKPHSFKGEINVDLEFDDDLFEDAKCAFFVKIDNIPVPFFAESIRNGSKSSHFIKFKDIDSDSAASILCNKEIFVLKDYLAEKLQIDIMELQKEVEGYEGYEIIDSKSNEIIGYVVKIEEGVEYDYLSVKLPDDKEIDIPFINEFIIEILDKTPEENGKMFVDLPEGFMEL